MLFTRKKNVLVSLEEAPLTVFLIMRVMAITWVAMLVLQLLFGAW
jgi:hypothetical protein